MPAPMSEDDEDVLNATVVEPKNNNKRSRKLVAKTFMDKDGYVGMFIVHVFKFLRSNFCDVSFYFT